MAKVLKGAPVAAAMREQLIERVQGLQKRGIEPTLAIIRVGERADDLAYERGAVKRCEQVGIKVQKYLLADDCAQEELMAAIQGVNENDGIHGCLLLRPLPKTLDEGAACEYLKPAKDVDCITHESMYGVVAGENTGFPPCTAEAVVALLDHYGVELAGARVTVVGRSMVIGKPVSLMLQSRNATVTMCHTRTMDLAGECRRADIVVVAAGRAGVLGSDAVSSGQVIIDVGINWDSEAQKLVGDVAFDDVEPIVDAITPVPGGLGPVTTAVLARHVVMAAEHIEI